MANPGLILRPALPDTRVPFYHLCRGIQPLTAFVCNTGLCETEHGGYPPIVALVPRDTQPKLRYVRLKIAV